MNSSGHVTTLLRKVDALILLSDEEKQALRSLPMTLRTFAPDQDIVREGDRPSECCLILDGFACRYLLLPNGKRQILSFHIPGDIPDLQSLHLKIMDHSLATLVTTEVAFIPHRSLNEINERYPRIASAFWRETLVDAAMFRLWIASIGRRSAYARIAHFLCELKMRLEAVSLVRDGSYNLPITQSELADAFGLSNVHVNRVLQELRGDGLITLRGSALTINDWEGLRRAADFEPAYLHLKREEEE